jgi:hypothetical protein
MVLYAADYGFSDRLSQTLAHGITKAGVATEMADVLSVDPQVGGGWRVGKGWGGVGWGAGIGEGGKERECNGSGRRGHLAHASGAAAGLAASAATHPCLHARHHTPCRSWWR